MGRHGRGGRIPTFRQSETRPGISEFAFFLFVRHPFAARAFAHGRISLPSSIAQTTSCEAVDTLTENQREILAKKTSY